MGNANAIPSGTGKGNLALSGTLDLNGNSIAVNGLADSAGTGTISNYGAADAQLTVGQNDVSSTYRGTIFDGSKVVGLRKEGTGNLALYGGNFYSGGTTIAAGQVTCDNDSAYGSGTITLSGGAMQAGSGTWYVNNNIVAQDGTSSFILTPSGCDFFLTGNLSGGGTVTRSTGGGHSVRLQGDNSNFTGTFVVPSGGWCTMLGGTPDGTTGVVPSGSAKPPGRTTSTCWLSSTATAPCN